MREMSGDSAKWQNYSRTGTRTRVSCVKGKYANHLHHTESIIKHNSVQSYTQHYIQSYTQHYIRTTQFIFLHSTTNKPHHLKHHITTERHTLTNHTKPITSKQYTIYLNVSYTCFIHTKMPFPLETLIYCLNHDLDFVLIKFEFHI